MKITTTSVALLLALSIPILAQPDATPPGWNTNTTSQPQSFHDGTGVPTLRTGVQLVLQDITVTDAAGHPVTNLKPEDFQIFEDDHPQSIKSFEEHSPVDPALAEQRAAALAHTLPPNTFTNYKAFSGGTVVAFLLDTADTTGCDSGTGVEAQMRLRQGMIDYMKTVPLGTPFIIFRLNLGLHMIQDMTTDPDALRTAVDGKKDNVEITPQLSSDDPRFPRYVGNLRRRQIVTAAMKELRQYLGGIPGRKNLVWFSGSLQNNLALIDPASIYIPTRLSIDPVTHKETYSSAQGEIDGLQYNGALNPPKEMKPYPTFRAYLDDITESLAQGRIALSPFGISCSYPVPKEQIAAVVDNSQHYYTLSYSPTNQNWNGHPRTFSVELADKTLHLNYRRTYLGGPGDTAVQHVVTPVETAAAAAVLHDAAGPSPTLQSAMGMGTVEPTQVIFEASATPYNPPIKDDGKSPSSTGNLLAVKLRRQGYRNYIVHFRVRADELKLTPSSESDSSYTGKLEFVAVVYDAQGQAVNGKRERTSINFPDLSDPQLQTASVTGNLTIQVPAKGSYFLRLGVRDTATDHVGALEIPIDRIPLPAK